MKKINWRKRIMALDINKIIMESINNTLTEEKDVKKEEIKKDDVKLDENETQSASEFDDIISAAIAPAISAGLGALSLRNRIRNLG